MISQSLAPLRKDIFKYTGKYHFRSIPYIFTAGDYLTGPALVIDTIGGGRRAARAKHLYLSGEDLKPKERLQKGRIPESDFRDIEGITKMGRPGMPEISVEERMENFNEVELTLSEEEAVKEAGRCLRCGYTCYWKDGQKRIA